MVEYRSRVSADAAPSATTRRFRPADCNAVLSLLFTVLPALPLHSCAVRTAYSCSNLRFGASSVFPFLPEMFLLQAT